MGDDKRYVVVYDEFIYMSPQAWGVVIDGQDHWFPKSLCTIDEDDKEILAPEWLLIKKGLESYIDYDGGVHKVW